MSENLSNSTPSATSARPRGRRASIASGTSFSELFARPGNAASTPQPPPPASVNIPGPIMSSANAQAQAQQRRRMSITTLGLSGSPTQQSYPFGSAPRMRRESISSSVMSSSPTREDAVLEENGNDTPMTSPTTPFARRVSFGAQAFRDRVGSANANGRYPSGNNSAVAGQRATSSVTTTTTTSTSSAGSACVSGVSSISATASTHKTNTQNNRSNPSSWRPIGEGFNWPEALRARAERAPSFGSFPPTSPISGSHGSPLTASSTSHSKHHQRSASIATMEQPIQDMRDTHKQKQHQPQSKPKPDYFQEKILRGDFMD
ncbi:hypothetical protein AJ78_07648 [Emergomyces pasteurianus Ep9510]|uniref:Uncharacterized protein n=1 Tax=Emergomyces pasteurianus Ep9510 TaxID=1447872 RepID=A0A1J9P5F2_9EURO|nr:hypothetical protein AJ78_07648 [Emergomyces pasteurianus Ep9510]